MSHTTHGRHGPPVLPSFPLPPLHTHQPQRGQPSSASSASSELPAVDAGAAGKSVESGPAFRCLILCPAPLMLSQFPRWVLYHPTTRPLSRHLQLAVTFPSSARLDTRVEGRGSRVEGRGLGRHGILPIGTILITHAGRRGRSTPTATLRTIP